MKTRIPALTAAIWCEGVLLLGAPAALSAEFTYTTNNGTITIAGYSGTGGAVNIPDTINGLPVAAIGNSAFRRKTAVTSVSVPDSVTQIGTNAFSSCTQLADVKLGNGLRKIESTTFSYCEKLACVTVPDSVTNIERQAFFWCTQLTNVTIGNGLRTIDAFAFQLCSQLASVNIPNGVISIGERAFIQCTALTYVMIPGSVTNIGFAPFQACTNVAAIAVDPGNLAYVSIGGVLFDRQLTTLIECPGSFAGTYTVPNSVTIIRDYAFCNCAGLTKLIMGDKVTYIGTFAFAGCYNLLSIRLSPKVWFIGGYAFEECASLTSVTIPPNVRRIEVATFYYCQNLQSVFFQSDAPYSVGLNAFFGLGQYATVYYLPGTSGWTPTFGGLPTVQWNPLVQAADASFGVRTNRFGFTVVGNADIPIVVEASATLANPAWNPLQSCNLTNGSFYFSDAEWTNFPTRFYRLRSP